MKIFILMSSVFLSFFSNAYMYGGSNLGIMGYKNHDCIKPSPPFKPYNFNSQWEVNNYNREVEIYNRDYNMYIDCLNDYINAANNDINEIYEKINEIKRNL